LSRNIVVIECGKWVECVDRGCCPFGFCGKIQGEVIPADIQYWSGMTCSGLLLTSLWLSGA